MTRSVSAFLILFAVPAILFAEENDKTALVNALKSSRIEPMQLCIGLCVESETEVKSASGESRSKFRVVFNQLEHNIWRADLDLGTVNTLMMSDGKFIFSAQPSDDKPYDYARLGFDSATHQKITKTLLVRAPYLPAATNVLDLDLLELFEKPTLELVSIETSESPTARPAQTVNWAVTAGPDEPGEFHGKITWLPNDGYLIERLEIAFGTPHNTRANRKIVFEVEYREYFGRLLPRVTKKIEPEIVETTKILSVSDANPDRTFYRAEAVGLQTPSKSISSWIKWTIGGIVFLLIAIFIARSTAFRQQD